MSSPEEERLSISKDTGCWQESWLQWSAGETVWQCCAGVGICRGVRACTDYFDFLDSTVAFCYTALPGSFIAEGSLFLSPHHQPSVLPNHKDSSLNLSVTIP